MKAIYPGTFDPITKGHIDIIKRAIPICDELIIAVVENKEKKPLFDLKKRQFLVEESLKEANLDLSKVKISSFSDRLSVDFAKEQGANVLIRGLRAVSDFEYEFQMSCMNSKLNSDIQTIFLTASDHAQFISSRFVKQIAKLGGKIDHLVEKTVAKELNKIN